MERFIMIGTGQKEEDEKFIFDKDIRFEIIPFDGTRPLHLPWLYENSKVYGDVREYIIDNLDVIKSEIKSKQR